MVSICIFLFHQLYVCVCSFSFTFVVHVFSKLIIAPLKNKRSGFMGCMDPAHETMLVVTWCVLGDFTALF